jgi:NAD(P) transhydrogenase subunit alpha
MKIGIPRETFPGERRVSLTPSLVSRVAGAGHEVVVEHGAGDHAGFPDSEYAEKGAVLGSREDVFRRAEVLANVRTAGANEEAGPADYARLKAGQAVIGFCEPLGKPEAAERIASTGCLLFAMELMPRISRAQSMDALSSMATVSGYKAVVMAAELLPRMFPMMMTAAGTIAPARVLVIGAGVAGLQAIATAKRLGAVVFAQDIRPAVREQVESLGARFLDLGLQAAAAETAGGYAKAMDKDFYKRQGDLLAGAVADSDVVISTAAVPGRKAPMLIPAAMVEKMRPGSVLIDLAAEHGGNCELTRPGRTVREHGVLIVGPLNLASSVPYHASQMYSRNVTAFLLHILKEGKIQPESEDPIVKETLVTREGRIVHPLVQEALTRTRATAGSLES